MAIPGQEHIDISPQPNEPDGSDDLFTAFNKIERNFTTLFENAGTGGGGGAGGTAADIALTPTGNITSTNVQGAIIELDSEKVRKSGDSMTGFLTLSSDPSLLLHAATKSYVDNQNRGFVKSVNLIAPDPLTGDVAINLVGTITGDTVPSGPPSPIGGRTDGIVYIISGSTDPNLNGQAFIWSDRENAWLEISPPGTAISDARYVQQTGDEMTGPLSLWDATRGLPSIPTALEHATNKQYVDSSIATAIESSGGGGGPITGTIPAANVTFAPGGGSITATSVQAAIQELDFEKVAKTGDTMTGALFLVNVPQTGNVNQAATRGYVDALDATNVKRVNGIQPINGNVPVSFGATLTGTFATRPPSADDSTVYIVSGDPNPDLNGQAFIYSSGTGQWLEISPPGQASSDARYVNIGGDTMSGFLTLNSDPTSTLHAATKQYVDTAVLTNGGAATSISLGLSQGANTIPVAIPLSSAANVWYSIDEINKLLSKLAPAAPPAFPGGQSLIVNGTTQYRITNVIQTPAPGGITTVLPGNAVSVLRTATYATNTINDTGPGDTGTVTAYLNGVAAGSATLTNTSFVTGTFGNLVIADNKVANLVHTSFDARATGSVSTGWNSIKIGHTGSGANTSQANWWYDGTNIGTPVVTLVSFAPTPGPTSLTYSSTVPHYNNGQQFTAALTATKLSGDFYPLDNNMAIGVAGGGFSAPATVSYADVGFADNVLPKDANAVTPLAFNTTVNIVNGTGASSVGPIVSIDNSYGVGNVTLSPGANILYLSSLSGINELNIPVIGVGTGSTPAIRIINPGNGDTPVFPINNNPFNSQNTTLQLWDATVVAGVLQHDQTNYSAGYLPAGPDLSINRAPQQYFTFKVNRLGVSKFDIEWTGVLRGLWVALPGSSIVTTAPLNNWLSLTKAYVGSGTPGTGTGGNGSEGAALGGIATIGGTPGTTYRVTATFGQESSSSALPNDILIRIRLNSGDRITALSLKTASN